VLAHIHPTEDLRQISPAVLAVGQLVRDGWDAAGHGGVVTGQTACSVSH
jgi:hypothetical protein